MKKKLLYICTLLICFLFVSCSTHKDKWINRNYHAVVGYYNALWNGKEALKEGQRTIKQNWKDDYTRILPIYINGTNEQAAAIKGNTDRAIEKGGKVVKVHSMRFSGVEKNIVIDDAYLLIGQACFYAHDYKGAEASFQYIIGNWKNRKEIYEPMLWLALTYSKEKKYAEAEIMLKQVQKAIEEKKAPKKLKKMMHLVWAENDIAQGKTISALQNLQLRKKNFFEKELNTRTRFIEGQIYMNNKQYSQATKCFKYTHRHASDYTMQFVSQLNIALCFDPAKKNSISIIEDLEDMLDDKKNENYLDQIYYAIGEIYFRNRSNEIACKKWEESVKYSTNNKIQKMASALRAANVYYDTLQNYIKAQMYYDTALNLMDKDYPSRSVILSRQRVLTSLVENLNKITRWDSLLALSELSESELNAKIEKWIADYKAEQKRKEEEAKIQQAILARNASMNNFNQLNRNTNNFYFSNPTTVQSGKLEFQRKWGERALDDNWRLSSKKEIGFEDEELAENGEENDSVSNKTNTDNSPAYTPDKREYYTKDIPFTQGAKDSAHAEIADALLEAGYIYFQGINNIPKAIETFIDLQTRYPDHINVLPSSYHLYKLYDQKGDYPNSNFYKNKILSEYPESEYAMMIKNPDYLNDIKNNNTLAERLYKDAYKSYANNEFRATIEKSKTAIDSIKIGPYIPRLKFLSALSKGKLYGVDSLADNLNMIIFNHPNSEVTPIIERQLQYLSDNYNIKDFDIKYDSTRYNRTLEKDSTSVDDIIPKDSIENAMAVNRDDILDAESLIYRNKDMQHYYLIFFDDSKIDISYIQKIICEYNDKNYPELNLQSTSQLFTLSDQMINVRKFKNKQEALEYFDNIQQDEEFKKLSPSYYRHCVISIQNYSTLYNKRNIDAYIKYFRLMYLKDREQ